MATKFLDNIGLSYFWGKIKALFAKKVSGATNGNFAALDSNGDLTDSGHKHGDYVTGVGTSGNNVTWTKNGVTNNLTVPYATAAGSLTSLSGLYWADIQLQNSSDDTKTPTFGTDSSLKYVVGEVYKPQPSQIWASPVIKYYWHDLFAFGRGIPLVKIELSTDGVNWTEADSTTESSFRNLFICKENQTINLLDDTHPYVRFTWCGGNCYSNLARWLVIGTTYQTSQATCTIVKEDNKSDGTTQIVSTSTLTGNSNPQWIRTLNNCANMTQSGMEYSGYNSCFFKITFSRTSGSGTKLGVSGIKYLTYRWGNQGAGSEYEYPYDWNKDADILPLATGKNLGSSSKRWSIYGSTGNFSGNITSNTFVKSGGTSSQFLKADGSVDSNTYLTSHQDISGKEDKTNKVISLSSSSTDTQYPSAKAVYDQLSTKQATLVSGTNIKTVNSTSLLGSGNITINDGVGFQTITTQQDGTMVITLTNGDTITVDLNHTHPNYYKKIVETTQPQGGFLPDVVYSLGVLSGNTTFSLAHNVVGNVNHYYWTFSTATTAITVTWPTKLIWVNGNVPTIAANKHYEISILDSIAVYMETSIQEED